MALMTRLSDRIGRLAPPATTIEGEVEQVEQHAETSE
jgi:hypothetical protein